MKFSRAFIPTLRQAPNDAEVISHQLLVRAGMIRKVAMGIYDFLPLGLRSLHKVENIVREELDRAGCQEVALPHMVPAELWQESGRWQKYGKELLRIQDRHERHYCFGPTHEEVICEMVRGSINSYKQLPLNLYQIQTKFRDEIRPRFGLMRGREFLMKDGYSFHTSVEDLDREYVAMREAYLAIFKRCGLECRAVDADTGAIGGSSSHEFMVLAETGEDVVASCLSCDYAANLEKACFALKNPSERTEAKIQKIATPGKKTIAEVSEFLKIRPEQMIKTLVYKADEHYAVVCVAGNREVHEIKLKNALGCDTLRLASDAEILTETGVPVGFLGPLGLEAKNLKVVSDVSVWQITEAASGANHIDEHIVGINVERDLSVKKDSCVDVSSVVAGDFCPHCQTGKLKLLRGIEVGHIFKLGKRYSEPMKLTYLDQQGREQVVIMGTYGIGVSRVMAACIEQYHDDKGISWPLALAPYQVHLVTLDVDDAIMNAAQTLYDDLGRSGIEVLWDDRDERAGVKFNDADLIGLPLQVVLGKRGLAAGQWEYKIRRSGAKGQMLVAAAVETVKKMMETLE